MNCQEARRHWNLYYDSEGEAELHFQLNEHLETCSDCGQWFDQQNRLEALIEERLGASAEVGTQDDGSDLDWSTILVNAGVTPAKTTRRWLFMGSALLALAASILLMLGFFTRGERPSGDADLALLSSEVHGHVSNGGLRPDFESVSDVEVDQYLLGRVSFPVRCPPRKDSGFAVRGAGLCELANQPAAYVVGSVGNRPVSIFVLPRASLAAFPRQRAELLRSDVSEFSQGGRQIVYSMIDQNVVLVVGEVERQKLTRVLKSYGTYPHGV